MNFLYFLIKIYIQLLYIILQSNYFLTYEDYKPKIMIFILYNIT